MRKFLLFVMLVIAMSMMIETASANWLPITAVNRLPHLESGVILLTGILLLGVATFARRRFPR
jgi:uncharacterized membrane protein SirB2